jgi:hypothetical protein
MLPMSSSVISAARVSSRSARGAAKMISVPMGSRKTSWMSCGPRPRKGPTR